MNREEIASKCHDIQVSLGQKEVPEFEMIPRIGMMVNLSLHIRGLPIIEYEKLKLVAYHYFNIPSMLFRQILNDLAEIEFVELNSKGQTIKSVLPKVPFFENVYEKIGEYAQVLNIFNEPEELALKILTKLAQAPTEKSNLYNLGAEEKNLTRNIQIGQDGGYIISKRARGKDIMISPLFFSENSDIYADLVAKAGTKRVQRILELIKKAQGWPLRLIEKQKKINGEVISDEDILLLKKLAEDGAVKPPSINTPHAGHNNFIFTPSPGGAKMNPSNREIYERAMALISSVRQGQLLPKEFRIIWPDKILRKLKRDGYISSNSEAYNQYHQLAVLKVGRLEHSVGDRYTFRLIETEENIKALDIALGLLETGNVSNLEINEDARIALQKDQSYVESIIASNKMREKQKIEIDKEGQEELENLLIKGLHE